MTEAPPKPAARRGQGRQALKLATAFLLPLFFVIVFPMAFVSAVHKPTAHEIPILVVGPEQVVGAITTSLDQTDAFAADQSDVSGEGKTGVEERTFEGAVEVAAVSPSDPSVKPSFTVTTYVANAAGRQIASTVQAVGADIAKQLGTTAEVVDVAPLAATDALGTTLFYLLTYTSLAAYLVIIVLMQVVPEAPLSVRFTAVAIAAIAAPLIVFGLSSIFVGDYGASFGAITALLGVNAIYVFTAGSAAILIEQFLGKAATFGVMAFIVFLNFPSAGGAAPASLLPPFWQTIHAMYFGSGAFESFRSIVYFDGNGISRWLMQLLAWTVGLILLNFVVYQTKKVRHQNKEIAVLRAAAADASAKSKAAGPEESLPDAQARKHVRNESYASDGYEPAHLLVDAPRRSITAGEGANR